MKGLLSRTGKSLAAAIVLAAVLCAGCQQFSKMQAKEKQSEAKINLSAIFTMQAMFQGERDTYAHTFNEMGWEPSGTHAYTYFLGKDEIQAKKGGPYQLPANVKAKVGKEEFLAVAVANIDRDDTLDVWTIDHEKNFENLVDDVMK